MSMKLEAMIDSAPDKLNEFFKEQRLGAPFVPTVGCLKDDGTIVTFRDVIESTRTKLEQAGKLGVTDKGIIDGLVKLAKEDQLRDPEVIPHHMAAVPAV